MYINDYKALNLNPGADLKAIKSAFRTLAKSYHPDANTNDKGDVDNFIRIQKAYLNLLKYKENKECNNDSSFNEHWQFRGEKKIGLDIYYEISILAPTNSEIFKIILPWSKYTACPTCLGQGCTLKKQGAGPIYQQSRCEKCQGVGYIEKKSKIQVKIDPNIGKQSKIRLKNAGFYHPKSATRGDLILVVSFTNQLNVNS